MYADLIRDVTRREKIRRYLRVLEEPALTTETTALMEMGRSEPAPTSSAAAADAAAAWHASSREEDDPGSDGDDQDGDDEGDMDDDDIAHDEEMTPGADVPAKDPLAVLARRGLVIVVSVHAASVHIPHVLNAPFSLPVPFADRLGLFLADGAVLPPGTYPLPDDGNVSIYPYTSLVDRNGKAFCVHARDDHYGKARYSFVELQAGAERWYVRVWMLFSCVFRGTWYKLAFVSMMKAVSRERYNTTRRTFVWNSTHLDCVEVGHILRTVIMVPSFLRRRAIDPEVFHLLE